MSNQIDQMCTHVAHVGFCTNSAKHSSIIDCDSQVSVWLVFYERWFVAYDRVEMLPIPKNTSQATIFGASTPLDTCSDTCSHKTVWFVFQKMVCGVGLHRNVTNSQNTSQATLLRLLTSHVRQVASVWVVFSLSFQLPCFSEWEVRLKEFSALSQPTTTKQP